ncbi:unnamed protein product [Arctia plantaginis]|uniref:Uncharacterized protein n=1 Tax=Arctia plantaginis TaxID=874455 RepID=A0A8S1AXQ2_ARCPL|nr:unnamed protein product [Arctia plantaginis]
MQRIPSSSSEASFWKTIELLAGRGRRRSAADADDCATFLDNSSRRASSLSVKTTKLYGETSGCTLLINKCSAKTFGERGPHESSRLCFAHPHVRARLEKHMGSNLVKLTDKSYMTELEERIRAVNEEGLNKRISARVLDEMERLKRLILVGKTPLKECPPELYHHPVFVFWRMVNREVARASKKRADAYYRKLNASQKTEQAVDEEAEQEQEEEEHEQITPEQLLAKCKAEIEAQKQIDIERGVRFTDEQFAQLKYETNDVKTLKNLTVIAHYIL